MKWTLPLESKVSIKLSEVSSYFFDDQGVGYELAGFLQVSILKLNIIFQRQDIVWCLVRKNDGIPSNYKMRVNWCSQYLDPAQICFLDDWYWFKCIVMWLLTEKKHCNFYWFLRKMIADCLVGKKISMWLNHRMRAHGCTHQYPDSIDFLAWCLELISIHCNVTINFWYIWHGKYICMEFIIG